MKKLTADFYKRDTLIVAKELIGKYIVHRVKEKNLVCRITETEAYTGVEDKACHAYQNRRTNRTEALYMEGGHAYVFLIYGMYDCMNVVTEEKNTPCAVLLRGCQPISPLDALAQQRYQKTYQQLTNYQKKNFGNGPGKLAKALAITREQNKASLLSEEFFLFEKEEDLPPVIGTSPRINIDYAEEYKEKHWRFFEVGSV
ncbi:MAG TPA: DNA-3-methyladenine glycosylase [Candidatus Coprocola pullicola]|nr:DNA-3-methyladenine glycosylase [Candidatus Coprocola pullicola]